MSQRSVDDADTHPHESCSPTPANRALNRLSLGTQNPDAVAGDLVIVLQALVNLGRSAVPAPPMMMEKSTVSVTSDAQPRPHRLSPGDHTTNPLQHPGTLVQLT